MSFSDNNLSDYENFSSSCDSDSDDDDYITFYSKTKFQDIQYFQIDISCFETSETTCKHYIIFHFANGDTTHNRLDNANLKKIFTDHGLLDEITNNELFSHLISIS